MEAVQDGKSIWSPFEPPGSPPPQVSLASGAAALTCASRVWRRRSSRRPHLVASLSRSWGAGGAAVSVALVLQLRVRWGSGVGGRVWWVATTAAPRFFLFVIGMGTLAALQAARVFSVASGFQVFSLRR